MKRISIIVLACLLVLPASTAFGQTRRRTAGRKSRSASSSSRTQSSAPAGAQAIASAAGRVAEQIKSLGRFLYLYGPISRELASGETGARNNPSAAEAVERNRAKLRDVFRGYSAQMDELETMFSSTQELRLYYAKVLGVAASATQAEESVAAGRYNAAGNSLLDVMNRLTDVLVEMRSR
ncbi:MAG TPA: hypothetical protein VE842_16160 [Pyrinomonadaceae bacterium]|nr:hypothetical protein [Pyrinomonadaceae bacterium]